MFAFYLHISMGKIHWREEGDLNIIAAKIFFIAPQQGKKIKLSVYLSVCVCVCVCV